MRPRCARQYVAGLSPRTRAHGATNRRRKPCSVELCKSRGRDRAVLPNVSNANEHSWSSEQKGPYWPKLGSSVCVRDVLCHDLVLFIVAVFMSYWLRVCWRHAGLKVASQRNVPKQNLCADGVPDDATWTVRHLPRNIALFLNQKNDVFVVFELLP